MELESLARRRASNPVGARKMFALFHHDENDREQAVERLRIVTHSSTGIEEHEFLEVFEY